MIIAAKTIIDLNKKYKLIEGLDEREINPEGTGFDVRVGVVYELTSGGYMGVKDRKTSDVREVVSIEKGDKEIIINPGSFYLIKTIETVNVPGEKIEVYEGKPPVYVMVNAYTRSSLFRCGINLMVTKTDPGYSGQLTFGMANCGNQPFRLELGARIANLVFYEVGGEISRAYGGQWNGGRVSTGGTEKQI